MRLQRSVGPLRLRASWLNLSQLSHGGGDVSPSPRSHNFHRDLHSSSSSSSSSRISPAVLIVIVILAVIFFVSGLIHLLFKFVIKKRPPPPPSSSSTSAQLNRRPAGELSGADALQRQLQSLFHLHDSGLDQAFIDALPVFLYQDLVGSKEPFDCAVCLCEFDDEDELRLLPACGHAFHLGCIDTWLLSNSTCPLCRGSLYLQGDAAAVENPVFDFGDSREEDDDEEAAGEAAAAEEGSLDTDKRVFPVRLGKFKSLGDGNGDDDGDEGGGVAIAIGVARFDEGETSSSSLEARRCFSMGSYQYVVTDANLQVAFKNCSAARNGGCRGREAGDNCTVNEAVEGKRLGIGGRRESFSVSKIWLWPNKKGNIPVPSDASALDTSLPWKTKMEAGDT
ncbi:hypothetical protein Cni_G15277 [Canna indica]|uniref:RING-type E3 ubiquitin transferase n=1 Tax=Canna indica TaxID=4628 RepID=A0AAQ3KD83_9LILI|nr:hypothetical protein Cni_G15277 [Canna indica]